MLTLSIDLLCDRYHATPFGRAANEGEPEWPPSPWRLGRAIVSAWWRTPPELRPDESSLNRILEALASPPIFALPPATSGHSRHYMPKPNARSRTHTTLVLDPFIRTDGSPLHIAWRDAELDPADRTALSRLLELVGYVGRAEGAAVVSLVSEPRGDVALTAPYDERHEEGEIIQVLCLVEAVNIDELSESTAQRRKRRLVSPAAGRWVSYVRPRGSLDPPRPVLRAPAARPIEALRFAIEGAAVPPVTDALRLAELYRAAALSRADEMPASVIALLRGRAEGALPLQGHVHAHYLPTDEDGDGRLDHLTVWCPAGLDAQALDALDITMLRSWAFDHPMRLFLLEAIEAPRSGSLGPLASARRWRSHTPFLPPRHPKRRAGVVVDAPVDQLRRELETRGLPDPVDVRPFRGERLHWGSFRRERRRAEHRPDLPALGFMLEFDHEVRGPISLGRNSHFGMGVFLPA